MKKLFLSFFIVFLSSTIFGQNVPNYPIPSYDISIKGITDFSNSNNLYSPCSLEKRKAIITIRSAGSVDPQCQATVWVYSLDHTTVFGPYTVMCGETLSVDIDDREWGVLVESEYEIITDVWFE